MKMSPSFAKLLETMPFIILFDIPYKIQFVAERKGWHGREIKLKEFKCEEGHKALRVK
jgi:hypothetical protein